MQFFIGLFGMAGAVCFCFLLFMLMDNLERTRCQHQYPDFSPKYSMASGCTIIPPGKTYRIPAHHYREV